ncbi:hypothetical protein [Holospora undulata]|nr:hypothetical protein [Holospora undulata]
MTLSTLMPTMATKIACQAPPLPRRPTRMNLVGALGFDAHTPYGGYP